MKLKISRKIIIPLLILFSPTTFFNFFLFLFLSIFLFIFIEIYRIYRYVEIRNDEILEKKGIIKIEIKRVTFEKISTIKKVQGPIARILKYGDMIFKTLDEEKIEAKYVSDPEKIEKMLKERFKF